jgi:hypothetical protein
MNRTGARALAEPTGLSPVRAREAKDSQPRGEPAYDVGLAVGGRRQAFILSLALLLTVAALLATLTTLGVFLFRNHVDRVPVSTTIAGTLSLAGDDALLADSILYRPTQVVEFAKRFVEVRYGYDWRAGRAKALSAISLMEAPYDQAMWPDVATLNRYDQQQMRVTFVFDSVRTEYLRRGIVRVIVTGRQRINNVQYPDPRAPRDQPFRQELTIHRVAEKPPFIWGLAVRGSDGDLK